MAPQVQPVRCSLSLRGQGEWGGEGDGDGCGLVAETLFDGPGDQKQTPTTLWFCQNQKPTPLWFGQKQKPTTFWFGQKQKPTTLWFGQKQKPTTLWFGQKQTPTTLWFGDRMNNRSGDKGSQGSAPKLITAPPPKNDHGPLPKRCIVRCLFPRRST